MANGSSTFSVIGSDVVITGDISASADLHIDGKIDGDIKCASLVQGEGSTINGAVIAESARMSGKVKSIPYRAVPLTFDGISKRQTGLSIYL